MKIRRKIMNNKYEIYACKIAGPVERPGALVMWNKDWDKIVLSNYYLWCIKGVDSKKTIVVDAGITPSLAEKLKLPNYVNPAEILARIDVNAEKIETVIISHLHWDHYDGMTFFSNATFYIQEAEYIFWVKDPLSLRPPIKLYKDKTTNNYLKSLEGTNRLFLLRGDRQILPGIECILTPGHSVANQAVSVSTEKGTAILGSDCAHSYKNYQNDWPSIFIFDLLAWMKSYDKLRSKASSAELLFPGHDPLMTENYPQVAEGVTRLV